MSTGARVLVSLCPIDHVFEHTNGPTMLHTRAAKMTGQRLAFGPSGTRTTAIGKIKAIQERAGFLLAVCDLRPDDRVADDVADGWVPWADPVFGRLVGTRQGDVLHVREVELLGLSFSTVSLTPGLVLERDATGTRPVAEMLGLVPLTDTSAMFGPRPVIDLSPIPGRTPMPRPSR